MYLLLWRPSRSPIGKPLLLSCLWIKSGSFRTNLRGFYMGVVYKHCVTKINQSYIGVEEIILVIRKYLI